MENLIKSIFSQAIPEISKAAIGRRLEKIEAAKETQRVVTQRHREFPIDNLT
jgi:hypothetical protein